jgi:hypothetical protein|nr:hypothetical protein [uncultured Acetatifactor sp.]
MLYDGRGTFHKREAFHGKNAFHRRNAFHGIKLFLWQKNVPASFKNN